MKNILERERNIKTGDIRFQRGKSIRRKRCEICEKTYEDTRSGRDHHFNRYYFHQEAKKKESESHGL